MARILLVEDDAELRLLLEHVLLGEGYEVDVTDGAAAAQSHLGERQYDLVIADARLPDGNGIDVADGAAETGAKGLVITGYAFEMRSEQLAGRELLLKPVRPDELLQTVERILRSTHP